MWINAQHPGLSFPASDGQSGPCSSTVLITRDDSGVIGTWCCRGASHAIAASTS